MKPPSFLLVDDLEENLLSLEALLRRDDLRLLKARSGDEALELLLQNEVALALIDVQMPKLDGFELAELMRGNERTRRVPIIFVTAGTTDNHRRFRGYEAGAVDFIQKPIEPDILRSKAEVFFQLYRQRQQITAQRDELAASAEALKEADRRKDEFLATLAHELRNPLAPLVSGLEVLRRSPDPDRAAAARQMMQRQLSHLVRLIDDLLDVSRISLGKIELRQERTEVGEIVRSAIEASQPLIDAGQHDLTVALSAEPLWLDADPTRLSQVISNLLNNAARYTPPGGRIRLSTEASGGNMKLEVSDNGMGIPKAMQSKIFDMFAQIDAGGQHPRGGLGIGLALVRQLVAMHGGTISVKSAGTGSGSAFIIQIPLAERPAHEEKQAETLLTPPQKLKVLVVDDNADVAQAVGWMLEELGHDYQVVNDGRLAVNAATEYLPDAILLDIGLPVMDGYEVCRALRQHGQFKDTPIIAQTGWGQDRDKAQSAEAGFDAHLTKPVAISDLEQILSNMPR